jgi:hypothetical protein
LRPAPDVAYRNCDDTGRRDGAANFEPCVGFEHNRASRSPRHRHHAGRAAAPGGKTVRSSPAQSTAAPTQGTAAPAQGAGARAEPGVIDRDKVPSNVQTMSASDFDHAKAPNLLDSLERGLPGVSLSDQTGNQFQQDLNYRGFIASPVIGTPQGLAVYQTACASTKSLATSSIGTSSRRTPSTS